MVYNEKTVQTTVTCLQLGNFINDMWSDITRSDSIQEVEHTIDMLEKDFGDSLGPCIGYEVLNDLTEDYNSVSWLLKALKSDAKSTVRDLYREGKHYGAQTLEDPRMTLGELDRLLKHIDQIGKDPTRVPKITGRRGQLKVSREGRAYYSQASD